MKSGYYEFCNGTGHVGGASSYRVCPKCGEKKANTAFRALDEVCLKCSRICRVCGVRRAGKRDQRCDKCGRRKDDKTITAVQHQWIGETRVQFDVWMEHIGASAADYAMAREAARQYGRKDPTPDELLEAHVRAHYPHDRKAYGRLFHAVVLLAHETNAKGRESQRKARSHEQQNAA